MKHDSYIDKYIGNKLVAANVEKEAKHVSSGKLSASMLGLPLQWQVLKTIGIPTEGYDEYTLRKFKRGEDIENWLVENIPDVVERQKFVEYRNTVGYVDALVNTKDWDFADGIIPLEVKSVSNAKFKRIKDGADRGHKLQAGLYAIALNSPHYAIAYVSTDDLRVNTYIYETSEIKDEIDGIITSFEKQLELKVVPVFEAEEAWQKNLKYNKYPEWSELTQEQINEKIKQYEIYKN